MAVTFTPNKPATSETIQTHGSLLALVGELTFSGSYATGGDTLDLSTILKAISAGAVFFVSIAGKAGYSFEYNRTTKKVIVRQGDNANAAAGPSGELPAAAYPAALTGLAAGQKVELLALAR